MSISSKFRLALAGLTAVALVGGVMMADPADAGKRKKKIKKAKITKIVQVNRSGDATGGAGGSGGAGGNSGKVVNTGDIGGGGVVTRAAFVADPAVLDCLFANTAGPATIGNPDADPELTVCLGLGAENPLFRACLEAAVPVDRAELLECIDRFDDPVVLGPFGGGAVFSGNGGAGGAGAAGGAASTGAVTGSNETSIVKVANG